jgi:hypothetical protein
MVTFGAVRKEGEIVPLIARIIRTPNMLNNASKDTPRGVKVRRSSTPQL